jgi:putative oxidoreductase
MNFLKNYFMELNYQIKKWEMDYPIVLTALRVLLGVCLTIRGLYFLNNAVLLQDLTQSSGLGFISLNGVLAAVITWVHILGGVFIILGLFTPIAGWAQVPIVLGAIIFVNTRSGQYSTSGDLLFSIFILVLLLIFAIGGGGKISMDNYLKKHLL